MDLLTHPQLLAATAQIHGTAWIGVGGAILGGLMMFLSRAEAIRRLVTSVAVAVSLLVPVAGNSLLPGLGPVLGVAGALFGVGAIAGVMLTEDRWNYLSACAGGLILVFFIWVVFFPQGESWSGDLLVLAWVPVMALAAWLPLALGVALATSATWIVSGGRTTESRL